MKDTVLEALEGEDETNVKKTGEVRRLLLLFTQNNEMDVLFVCHSVSPSVLNPVSRKWEPPPHVFIQVVAESLVDDDVSESGSGIDDAITTSAVIQQVGTS